LSLFLKKRVIINNYQLHVKKGKMEPDIIIIISCPENRMEVYIKFILKKPVSVLQTKCHKELMLSQRIKSSLSEYESKQSTR